MTRVQLRSQALAATALLSLATAIAGCDASEPIPYVPSFALDSGPVPQLELCAALAQNVCATLRPCCAASPYAFDEQKCRIVQRGLCEAQRNSAQEHGLSYDDELAGRCVAGTPSLVRDCAWVDASVDPIAADVVAACQQVWHGEAMLGEDCDPRNPFACSPRTSARVSCYPDPLRPTCKEQRLLGGGESCDPAALRACAPCGCAPGLSCRESRCTGLFHPLLAPCTGEGECGPARRCSCEGSDGICQTGEVRRCRPLPSVGEKCTVDFRCARGARCAKDKNDVCVDGKPLGAPCTDGNDCATGNCRVVCAPAGLVDPLTCDGVPAASVFGPYLGFVPMPSFPK